MTEAPTGRKGWHPSTLPEKLHQPEQEAPKGSDLASLQRLAGLVLAHRDKETDGAAWPGRQHLLQAINHLGLAVESDEASDSMTPHEEPTVCDDSKAVSLGDAEVSPTIPWVVEEPPANTGSLSFVERGQLFLAREAKRRRLE